MINNPTLEAKMGGKLKDGFRHIHVLMPDRDWRRFKRYLFEKGERLSPAVRGLISREIGDETGSEKAEPRVQPAS
jgi:hypothetical protein